MSSSTRLRFSGGLGLRAYLEKSSQSLISPKGFGRGVLSSRHESAYQVG